MHTTVCEKRELCRCNHYDIILFLLLFLVAYPVVGPQPPPPPPMSSAGAAPNYGSPASMPMHDAQMRAMRPPAPRFASDNSADGPNGSAFDCNRFSSAACSRDLQDVRYRQGLLN